MTRGMVSITSRVPSRHDPSQASSQENKSASLSTPENTSSRRCTAWTSSPPRFADSSVIWSIMLIAIESSCMLCLHRSDSEVAPQVWSHRDRQPDQHQPERAKNQFCIHPVTSPLSVTAPHLPVWL